MGQLKGAGGKPMSANRGKCEKINTIHNDVIYNILVVCVRMFVCITTCLIREYV